MTVFLLCAGCSLHMFTQFNKEFNVRWITSSTITMYEINSFLTFGLIQHFGLVLLMYTIGVGYHSTVSDNSFLQVQLHNLAVFEYMCTKCQVSAYKFTYT